MTSNREIALRYLENGLCVIPLWSPDMVKKNPPKKFQEELKKALEANEKRDNPLSREGVFRELLVRQCKYPAIPSWAQYQKRLPTSDEVTAWFTSNPTANIAIVTGKVSGVVVFDLDSKEAQEFVEARGGFPETPKAKTGKGWHIYMKYPNFDVSNRVSKHLEIDIRADGGYVVAPPSIHGSGQHYIWEEGSSVFEIDPADCTPWMEDYLKNVGGGEKPTKKSTPAHEFREAKKNPPDENEYTQLLRDGCKKGERNDKAARLIGHLLKKGNDPSEVWEMVRTWNREKNDPPLGEAELKKTFESVAKLESRHQQPQADVTAFLDTEKIVVSEYEGAYVRVPFARDELSLLEKRMNGGLVGGRFYLFGGIPTAGKTSLLNTIADNICLNGYPVLFFSFDDGRGELRNRTLARFSHYSIEDFNTRSVPKEKVKEICEDPVVREIMKAKYVSDQVIPVERWEKLVEQIKSRHERAPVVMIDYLRKVRTGTKTPDERLRVDAILSKLSDLAKKHNIPILAISELARDSYKAGQRLSMASLKESGTIEYEASWLGILAVTEETDGEFHIKNNWEKIIKNEGNVDIIVFKTKRGTGATGRIGLKIDKQKMTVSDRKDPPDWEKPITPVPKESMFGLGGEGS